MAKGFTQTYRCYNFVDKNPVIDKMRTILQDEGLYDKSHRKMVHELSGVSVSTMDGWFEGDTRSPRHETTMAIASALGYVEEFVKVKEIDLDKELNAGRRWLQKRREERAAKSRRNGRKR